MSAPMENVKDQNNDLICEIEATVTTGLEPTAMDEAIEKLGAEVTVARGRIVMKVPIKKVKKVLDLGCVDNCYILVTKEKDFPFVEDEIESMRNLRELVRRVDWDTGLSAWNEVFSFQFPIKSVPDVIPDSLGEPTLSSRINKPKKGDNGGKKSKRQKRREQKEKRIEERKKKQDQESQLLEEKGSGHNDEDKILSAKNENETCKNSDNKNENNSNSITVDAERLAEEDKKSAHLSEKRAENDLQTNDERTMTETETSSEPTPKRQKLTDHDPTMPAFRVTCHRSGDNHSFDSMGAQSNFGGAINDYFKWNVSMKEYDIEVMLYIDGTDVRVCLALTKHSLHRRNTTAFGPTTLRPTIAYNMLRMCKIQPGEIVCDPMCGSGVIPIQAALGWPQSMHIAGEIVSRALHRTLENLEYVNKVQMEKEKPGVTVHIMKWDVCRLPYKDSSVDVFITDLPFGIRLGSKAENYTLYPRALHEISRVATLKTGRVCVLTQDKKGINKAMQMVSRYWKRTNAVGINMGGLAACVYLMYRNSEVFDKSVPLVFPENPPEKGANRSSVPERDSPSHKKIDSANVNEETT